MNFLEDGFGRKLFLSFIFFLSTPIVILTSLFSLYFLSTEPKPEDKVAIAAAPMYQSYSAYEDSTSVLGLYIEEGDARVESIKNYLRKYDSPLYPYAQHLVETSDKYLLDYRLIPAIAQQESNLCKVIPEGSYNCWGWGIHSKGTLKFQSFEEAIDTVTKGIRDNYINKGFNTVDEIMKKYTPQSDGSWANGVKQFMLDIESPS